MRRIAGLVPQPTCYYCMPCKRRFAPNGNAKPVFHLNLNLRFPAMVGSWKSQISNHQVWVTQVTQQPQPPQTSRENCNLDNSSLALFLSLWIDNVIFDIYCSISCWSCLLGDHLIRLVTSHLVFARSASCSRLWKQVWCAGSGLISFTPWRKMHLASNTYMAKIYLASFRNQLRHIDSPLYVSYLPERGVTILETAGLSFHVLFCSDLTLAGNILVQTWMSL